MNLRYLKVQPMKIHLWNVLSCTERIYQVKAKPGQARRGSREADGYVWGVHRRPRKFQHEETRRQRQDSPDEFLESK